MKSAKNKPKEKKKTRWNSLANYDFAGKFKLTICLPLFGVLVLFDWITKIIVQTTMDQGQTKKFLPGFLKFEYIINPGSAYGFNADNLALAVSLAAIVTVILIVAFVFVNAKHWLPGLATVIAGSLANLLARSWAPAVANIPGQEAFAGVKGGVIDFLRWDFSWLNANSYVFNFADVWVILGIVMVVLGILVNGIMYAVKKSREKQQAAALTVDVEIPKNKQKGKAFIYKDESGLTKKELIQYRKELRAYRKMKKREEKKNAKNHRQKSHKNTSR